MKIDTKEILNRQKIGLWNIEIEEGKPIRLLLDDVMAQLMGISCDLSPEQAYEAWQAGTDEESGKIMADATAKMISGSFAEAQYSWNHPDGSRRVVRCGGSRDLNCKEYIKLLGSHRDITHLIHLDEEQRMRDKYIIDRYLDRAKCAIIVNVAQDTYSILKRNPENDSVYRFEDEGVYSEFIHEYINHFVAAPFVRRVMEIADPKYLRQQLETIDYVRVKFRKKVGGIFKWYQLKANKLSENEVYLTFHDIDKMSLGQLFWESVSTHIICGFIVDLLTNTVTLTKKSPLFSAIPDLDILTLSDAVELAASMMDDEYKEDWRKFCQVEKLRSISRESRRAEFSFTSHATGRTKWIRASWYPLVTNDGGATLSVSFHEYSKEALEKMKRDEEYHKALKDMRLAEEASRLKTEFVQNISHDIRTPLNAIVGFSQLLSMPDGFLDEKERDQYAEYITDSAELLTMIVNDVLSMSDVERDVLNINHAPSFCNEICRKSVNCSTMRVPAGVKMYYTSEVGDDFQIETDAMRVQQILVNFLSNACKHTMEGEIRVHCSVKEHPGQITFSVTDTGEGIAKDMADILFERFTTMDSSKGGHGMGLNICRNLSQRLGGYVSLDRSYRNGARFELVLPVK